MSKELSSKVDIWGQALVPHLVLSSPICWGWIRTDAGLYEPHWTTFEEASKTCHELIYARRNVVPAASAK